MRGNVCLWSRDDVGQGVVPRGLCLVATLLLAACSSVPGDISKNSPTADTASLTVTGNQIQSEDKKPPQTASRSPAQATPESADQASEQTIYFASGNAGLSEENREKLKQAAQYLKQNPKRLVTLMAFSDSLGSRTYTLAIMDKRLGIVAEALHDLGIAKTRIRKILISQKGPKRICATPDYRGEEQRVELRYR